jgi:TetR/AcrR family acrAB operon transcriptional repressor
MYVMGRLSEGIMVRRTKEEAQATRQHIIDAAEREFLRRGVARTTLQDIADAAGLTRGAIYWHFKDKADVFDAMLSRVVLPMEQAIDRSGDPSLGDPLASIRDGVLDSLRRAVEDAQTRRVFEIAMHKVEYVDEMSALRERRLQSLRERTRNLDAGLQRARAQGRVAEGVATPAAALGLFSLASGLLQNWMLDPAGFDLQRVGRQVIDAYLRGLQPAAAPGDHRPRPGS